MYTRAGCANPAHFFACFPLDHVGATFSNDLTGFFYCFVFDDIRCTTASSSTSLWKYHERGNLTYQNGFIFGSDGCLSAARMAVRLVCSSYFLCTVFSFIFGRILFIPSGKPMFEGGLWLARVAHISAMSDRVNLLAARRSVSVRPGTGPRTGGWGPLL